jgi:hypothetical protein
VKYTPEYRPYVHLLQYHGSGATIPPTSSSTSWLASAIQAPPANILTPDALKLRHAPIADCARYDNLRRTI